MNITKQTVSDYYKKVQIETAPKRHHIVMLHDKLVLNITQALTEHEQNRVQLCAKAQNITVQLRIALDFDRLNPITNYLDTLYAYIYSHLESNEVSKFREALDIAEILRDAFTEQYKRK